MRSPVREIGSRESATFFNTVLARAWRADVSVHRADQTDFGAATQVSGNAPALSWSR